MKFYKPIKKITRDKAIAAISTGEPYKISEALLSLALYEEDYDWVFNFCFEFLENEGIEVKATAILCISHIARIHKKIDKDLIIPKLKSIAHDTPELAGRVEDVLEDIDIFVM